ncbi:MAG TPA: hypothetical protein VEK57_29255 [Thermoanaerobaculia bacterium]|nr:hypothetical protein [Thermoanaerobaculia bacterium]
MIQRFLLTLLFLCLALRAEAAMVRVLEVVDGRTIVIDRAGSRATVTLAGIALTDEAAARTLLEWTLASTWVMLEEQPNGGAFVYRSPDALFLNRELVLRGFARATLRGVEPEQRVPVTYLGQLRPSGPPPAVEAPAAPKRRSGSGTRRRSPAAPSRSTRRGGS